MHNPSLKYKKQINALRLQRHFNSSSVSLLVASSPKHEKEGLELLNSQLLRPTTGRYPRSCVYDHIRIEKANKAARQALTRLSLQSLARQPLPPAPCPLISMAVHNLTRSFVEPETPTISILAQRQVPTAPTLWPQLNKPEHARMHKSSAQLNINPYVLSRQDSYTPRANAMLQPLKQLVHYLPFTPHSHEEQISPWKQEYEAVPKQTAIMMANRRAEPASKIAAKLYPKTPTASIKDTRKTLRKKLLATAQSSRLRHPQSSVPLPLPLPASTPSPMPRAIEVPVSVPVPIPIPIPPEKAEGLIQKVQAAKQLKTESKLKVDVAINTDEPASPYDDDWSFEQYCNDSRSESRIHNTSHEQNEESSPSL